MIEEQALCRVHRVGQRRNVTTIRYVMRDSFEEVCYTFPSLRPSSISCLWRPESCYENQMLTLFPQQVVQIQKRKKLLAKVTFCQGPLSEAEIGLGTLQVRSVVTHLHSAY